MNAASVLPFGKSFPPAGNEDSAVRYLLISPSGVLYDDTLWWRWLLQLLPRFGLHTNNGAFTALWRQDYYASVCRGDREFFDALRGFLRSAGLSAGQIDEVCAAGRSHWRQLELELRAFPRTVAALSALTRQGRRMGLLVQSPLAVDETRGQLQAMGVLAHCQELICSRELGCGLSAREYWPEVLERLSLPAAQVALVSSQPCELAAAREAGLATLAFQCDAMAADFSLSSIDELAMLSTPARMVA